MTFSGSPSDYVNFQSWGGQGGHRLEVMPQSKFSGVSGCSDAAVSQGSVCGTPTPDVIVMGETPRNPQGSIEAPAALRQPQLLADPCV